MRRIRVFLASPGDVVAERDALEEVVSELNHTLGQTLDFVVELVRWETHTWPGFGQDAQDVINAQIAPYDVFLGVMWARFGSPTGRAPSGTVEEFESAYKLWQTNGAPHLMCYFCSAPFSPDSPDTAEQFEEVQRFKESLGRRGALYWQYADVDDFRRSTYRHLHRHLSQLPVNTSSAIEWHAALTYARGYHRIIALSHPQGSFELDFRYKYVMATVKVNGHNVGKAVTFSGPEDGCAFSLVASEERVVSGRILFTVNTLLSKFPTFSVWLDGQCVYTEDNRVLKRG